MLLLLFLSSFPRIIKKGIHRERERTRTDAMDMSASIRTKEFHRNKLPECLGLAYSLLVFSKAELYYYPFHSQMLLLMMKLHSVWRETFQFLDFLSIAHTDGISIAYFLLLLVLQLVLLLLFGIRIYIYIYTLSRSSTLVFCLLYNCSFG